MKRNILVVSAVVFSLFITSANLYAQDKIGFINMREVIQTSNAGKRAGEEMKRIADRKQAEITSMERELKSMKEELDKKSSVMTASARSEKESAYQKKMRSYNILVNDANEELQKKDQEIFQKLMPDILKVVRSIGEKEKYTLIVDVATMPVPYFDKSQDITKKVVDEFNKK
ncbi:MAG TPA: OmpH family outer membrane protein [Smithellaceae bacterium]|nr:OmpH family outer membrane protein [Smithellaceae bacterium]HRS89426.1 OmpH family outer membrane protein [Smithellaceae bacterium]HRV26165.1 OmpH family outer membrane protein [Smithellaceae bacterium]